MENIDADEIICDTCYLPKYICRCYLEVTDYEK
jgi:hypothetical protein